MKKTPLKPYGRRRKREDAESGVQSRRSTLSRSQGLSRGSGLTSRTFSEVHEDDPRYGPEWEAIRDMPCFLAAMEYEGPGHERCGPGTMMFTHTAAHLDGRTHLCLPACGRAHDLIDGRGGRKTVEVFRAWVAGTPSRTLKTLAEEYWRRAAETI